MVGSVLHMKNKLGSEGFKISPSIDFLFGGDHMHDRIYLWRKGMLRLARDSDLDLSFKYK
jgi:hypothetical protein